MILPYSKWLIHKPLSFKNCIINKLRAEAENGLLKVSVRWLPLLLRRQREQEVF